MSESIFENEWKAYNSRNKSFFQAKNLEEFVSSDLFSETITSAVDITRGELFLMIVKYSLSNSLTLTAMTNLFKLINAMFKSQVLPESSSIVDKLLNPKGGVEFHAVCPKCSSYFGKFGNIEVTNLCTVCQATVKLDNPSDKSFFALIDPSNQISDLINAEEKHYKYVTEQRSHETNHLHDI